MHLAIAACSCSNSSSSSNAVAEHAMMAHHALASAGEHMADAAAAHACQCTQIPAGYCVIAGVCVLCCLCRTNFMALWLNGFVMIPSVNIPAVGSDYLQVTGQKPNIQ
jgi:hypothetical protein